jgi:ABC-2 type transport system permease protein
MSRPSTDGFEHGAATRHLRLLGAQLRLSVLAALEYRVGFLTDGVVSLAWGLGGVVPLFVAFDHRQDVAGWGAWEIVMLTGFFLIFSGTFGSAVQPAVNEAMGQIRNGTLDYVLLRPVDALLSCLLSAFQPWCLLEAFVGVGMIALASVQLHLQPDAGQIGMLLLVFASGLVSLYAIAVLILAASFRALELENLTYLMETLLDFAHWPISVFRGPLKLIFTFVVPFAVMTSYPAQSLIGSLSGEQVLGALASAATLAVVARLAWLRGVRGYTSASS